MSSIILIILSSQSPTYPSQYWSPSNNSAVRLLSEVFIIQVFSSMNFQTIFSVFSRRRFVNFDTKRKELIITSVINSLIIFICPLHGFNVSAKIPQNLDSFCFRKLVVRFAHKSRECQPIRRLIFSGGQQSGSCFQRRVVF